MENIAMSEISLKKVTSRGRRYVYLRGTNIALVKGFRGTEAELDGMLNGDGVARQIAAHRENVNALTVGRRMDAAKILHKVTRARARSRDRAYSLSVEMIATTLAGTYDRCEITGMRFDYGPKTEAALQARPMAPSLDRISNKGGYDPVNVRVVCVCVNVAINEWGLANFEKMCRSFVARNG